MNDLARQAAEAIGRWVDEDHPGCPGNADTAQKIMERHGTLVSHEDAAWLALARSTDPLTLERAVAVMGREPDRKVHDKVFVWEKEDICFVWSGERSNYVVVKESHWYLPTVGVFALLAAAARQGASE